MDKKSTCVIAVEKKLNDNDRRDLPPLMAKVMKNSTFFNLDIQAHNVYLPAKGVRGAETDP